jgi:hypothetical protein
MLSAVSMRSAEHYVPQRLKRAILPAFLPGRTPFVEANHRHRAIFIHIPKTAGTSIHGALGNPERKHAPLSRYAAYDPERTAAYFKFAFVRNPWDRFLSAYSYLRGYEGNPASEEGAWSLRHIAPHGDFEGFVRALQKPLVRLAVMSHTLFLPQHLWLDVPGRPDLRVDYLGRFETIHADFVAIAARLRIGLELDRLRPSARPPHGDAYGEAARAIIGRLYARDIALFGYTFDGRVE